MDDTLLRAILATIGRVAFPVDELLRIVGPTSGSEKQIEAYNLCDGNTTQAEICKKTGLHKGSLSRSVGRWIEEGVIYRVGQEQLLLHIYPLSKTAIRRAAKLKEDNDE